MPLHLSVKAVELPFLTAWRASFISTELYNEPFHNTGVPWELWKLMIYLLLQFFSVSINIPNSSNGHGSQS